jgi:hypothetical protein
MTNDEKAIAILTRCGPYSLNAARAELPHFTDEERAKLVEIHGRLDLPDDAAQLPPPQGPAVQQILDALGSRRAKAETERKAAEKQAAHAAKVKAKKKPDVSRETTTEDPEPPPGQGMGIR